MTTPSTSDSGRLDLAFTGIASFLRGPVCTNLNELDADFAFIGFPSDEGSGWMPGARFGPRSVREMSLRFRSCNTGEPPGIWDIHKNDRMLVNEFANERFVDCGDVDVIYTNMTATWDNCTDLVMRTLRAGATPVVVGGDHSATYPVMRAFGEPVQLLHFDAHLDYQPFVHGVTQSHGNPVRMANSLPHVQHITQAGIRSLRTAETHYLDAIADGCKVLTTADCRDNGADRILENLNPELPVYISVDLDVLDSALVPGVATPEPDGLNYEGLRDILCGVASEHDVVGIDMVELNPMLDSANKITSFLCTQMMVEVMGSVARRGRRSVEPASPPASSSE